MKYHVLQVIKYYATNFCIHSWTVDLQYKTIITIGTNNNNNICLKTLFFVLLILT